MKKNLKKLFRAFGFELKRYSFDSSDELLLNHILKTFHIQTILDVGANEGQYALQTKEAGFAGVIYSFEPLSAPFKKLAERANGISNWKVINKGIGSKDSEMTINVSENIVSSSIFEVEPTSVSANADTRIVRQEKIKITCIDTFLANQTVTEELMLKLDVQGYEMEALKGAADNLSRFKIIQAELSLVPVYQNAPLYDDIIAFLKSEGFEMFTILPGFRDPATGRLLQADGVFVRKQ
jgi:FkbM family methyltransferase